MNCFNHSGISAVALCKDCHKGLCPQCANAYSFPICSSCNQKRAGSEKRKIYTEFIFTIGGGLLSLVFAEFLRYKAKITSSEASQLSNIYIHLSFFLGGCAIVSGWYALRNVKTWVFYIPILGFILRLYASAFIGVICLLFRTIRNIIRLTRLNIN